MIDHADRAVSSPSASAALRPPAAAAARPPRPRSRPRRKWNPLPERKWLRRVTSRVDRPEAPATRRCVTDWCRERALTATVGWLVGVEFNAPLDTISVISEAVFAANHLTDTDKQNSTGKYR